MNPVPLDDDTMLCQRLSRRLFRYRTLFLFFTLVLGWLFFLEPCLVGLGKLCQLDKVQPAARLSANWRVPFPVQKKTDKNCKLASFNYGSHPFYHKEDYSDVACKVASPYPDSCTIAKELFFSESPGYCSHQSHFKVCYLEKSPSNIWSVRCNATEAALCDFPLALGMPDPKSGFLNWNSYNDTEKLAYSLTDLLRSRSKHFGFAFIRCMKSEENQQKSDVTKDYYSDDDYYAPYSHDFEDNSLEQLLLLPPSVQRKENIKEQGRFGGDVNVNVIMLDSTSRQHFFRSLKKTVSVLEAIASRTNSTAYVLDFEMMQAVKSRTFETLQTLFSGQVNISETPFPEHGIPPQPLQLATVYKKFHEKSFRTLWMEDLCYLWEWGISKDLHFLNLTKDPSDTWELMWRKLQENYVDDIDLTISMCKILEANDMKDPFRHTNPLCFNGKYQHEYMLDYLKLYQSEMQALNQPLFTVTSLNTAHEETGRRVQTLDQDLADYVSFLPSMENTISIIFSDHGNSYGNYFTRTEEARAELFHPFMFFVIPKALSPKFSPALLSALKTNTKRLITVLDLHHTLLFLANNLHNHHHHRHHGDSITNQSFPVSTKGLFEVVDSQRTCESVPRIPPNLCICDSHDVLLASSSFQALFGYHAIGAINTEIQRQFLAGAHNKSTIHSAFGRCEALSLYKMSNIRENRDRETNEFWKVSMDIHVQDSQVFFISVTIKPNSKGHYSISLETITRISKYGPYAQCADPGVDLSLCICNISSSAPNHPPSYNAPSARDLTRTHHVPDFQRSIQDVSGADGCLLIVSEVHPQGMAVFVANTCGKLFIINLDVLVDEKNIFWPPPSNVLLLPGGFAYLALMVNMDDGQISCPIRFHFQEAKNVNHYL